MRAAFAVRKALASDSEALYRLICELAVFERAPLEVINTPEKIARDGWGDSPKFVAWVAESDGVVAGMALCCLRYSTWKGPVLYLEDLIVSEEYRGQGMGKALFETCLNYASENGYVRMNWQVLDWNQSAMDFYEKYGATFDGEWVNCTLSTSVNESSR